MIRHIVTFLIFALLVANLRIGATTAQIALQIEDIAWRPDGQQLAVAADGILLYDLDSQVVGEVTSSGRGITWSPNGDSLAVIGGQDISIFDTQTFEKELTISRISNTYLGEWSPVNDQLASTIDNLIQIWDTSTGQLIREMSINGAIHRDLAWHEDGVQLATSATDSTVRIWNTSTGQVIKTLQHDRPVEALAWSPDFTQLASMNGNDILIWNVSNGQQIRTLSGHTNLVNDLDWSSTGLASTAFDQTIHVWDVTTGEIVELIQTGLRVPNILWSPTGNQLAYWGRTEGTWTIIPVPSVSSCSPIYTVVAGDVSGLVNAINAANANTDASVIGLSAGTYTFTAVNNNVYNALPRIATDITICSQNGATLTRQSGAPSTTIALMPIGKLVDIASMSGVIIIRPLRENIDPVEASP